MMMIMLVFLLTVFLFSSFTISLKLQTINRAVIYMPKEIFETAIPIVNIDETSGLYFNKTKLANNIETYLDEKISRLMSDYTYSLYYYNQTNGSICTSANCNAVEVTVTGHYSFDFLYERSISYEIHRGATYGQ